MITDKKGSKPGAKDRPMIAPKNPVRVANESDRQIVVAAARAVISEHRDVIKALAKR
ncbi:hypothetical protein AWB64_05940 [Caballeronia sordidicola]|uniref:Uncharacterized protein n=1 Tax=Caballeronia sordidicola TaxID=196367 RepID=A0A158ID78_CABSO|nr:hypothetical protein [Caballeronia sordidicola]SAL54081.1 hypothetical protein AWB64_05940 [Caballeronia sordidicola]